MFSEKSLLLDSGLSRLVKTLASQSTEILNIRFGGKKIVHRINGKIVQVEDIYSDDPTRYSVKRVFNLDGELIELQINNSEDEIHEEHFKNGVLVQSQDIVNGRIVNEYATENGFLTRWKIDRIKLIKTHSESSKENGIYVYNRPSLFQRELTNHGEWARLYDYKRGLVASIETQQGIPNGVFYLLDPKMKNTIMVRGSFKNGVPFGKWEFGVSRPSLFKYSQIYDEKGREVLYFIEYYFSKKTVYDQFGSKIQEVVHHFESDETTVKFFEPKTEQMLMIKNWTSHGRLKTEKFDRISGELEYRFIEFNQFYDPDSN